MLVKIISMLLDQIFKSLSSDDLKEVVDTLLDKLEDKIHAKPDSYDVVLQGLINGVRKILDIQDLKYGIDKQ